MSLAPGTRVGVYEVVGALGAGGMGEVYRARDAHLDREVALKILPDHFAADPDRIMRFEREARTLAALNHPNIAQIHGFEHHVPSPGSAHAPRALVMELVEGEDLAQQIARGPLPLDEAVSIARQIAEGLEAAHEAGIVHRDLKPANIKVRADGTVKVLDFGLAKVLEPAVTTLSPGVAELPTITSPALTRMGVILGTASYMAPEQARGKAVDKRADIWAFGCILYEMLTGRKTFAGETVTDTIAAIMTRDADMASLPAAAPPVVRRLIGRCLERDPKRRLRDIGEARIALATDLTAGASVFGTPPQASRSHMRTLVGVAAALALAITAGVVVWQLRAPAAPPERRFTITIPGDMIPLAVGIAPDGSAIAFIADDRLWLQRLDEFTPSEVPGASGARALFWSPDSAFLGFQARGHLWKVARAGGAPLAIGRVSEEFTRAGGAAWLDDGRIVFTTGGTGLLEIPPDGGAARPLLDINPNQDADFHNVAALPGGRGMLFVRHPRDVDANYSLEVYVPSDGTRRVLYTGTPFHPVYANGGHILFEQAGAVWMLPFALDRLEATGAATRLQPDARFPSVSTDGTLVMLPAEQGAGEAKPTWLDRAGNVLGTVGQPTAPVLGARISPDGRFVAAAVGTRTTSDIWLFDVGRGTDRRLTFEGGSDPFWTPDGRHVIYTCGEALCARRADGGGARVELFDGVVAVGSAAISPDGKHLVFPREFPETSLDLWIVELGADGPVAPVTSQPRPLVATPRDQLSPVISPDGRFMAYGSSEAGQYGVYVTRFPEGDGKWAVSSGYGSAPRWGAQGDRLYFLDNSGRIVEMEVSLTPTFEPGRILGHVRTGGFPGRGFDIAPDGQRVLVQRSAGNEGQHARLLVVLNWR